MRLLIEAIQGRATLQDGGRPGQRSAGVPLGGFAVETWAQQANHLVRNAPAAPLIELVLGRMVLRAQGGHAHFVWVGPEAQLLVDGVAFPQNRSHVLREGQSLAVSLRTSGFGYLAVGGRWEVPMFRGSCSPLSLGETVLPIRLPEKKVGPVLARGDLIEIRAAVLDSDWQCAADQRADLGAVAVDFFPGPEFTAIAEWVGNPFWAMTRQTLPFAQITWNLSEPRDRMGLRLVCSSVAQDKSMSGLGLQRSGAVLPGVVQLLPDGSLVVLGVDAATVGGYPRIGYVSKSGLDRLYQLNLGSQCRLEVQTIGNF